MPAKITTAGYHVTYDSKMMSCDCNYWQHQFAKWFANSQSATCVPVCGHILEVLQQHLDSLPKEPGPIDVIVFGTNNNKLSLTVNLDGVDDRNMIGCRLPDIPGPSRFLGYLPASSSRADMRELLVPLLVEYYFETRCGKCGMGPVLRPEDAADGLLLRAIMYDAGYRLRHGNVCPVCDTSDLVPNPSPNISSVIQSFWKDNQDLIDRIFSSDSFFSFPGF